MNTPNIDVFNIKQFDFAVKIEINMQNMNLFF